jgi:Protein of unknown function (DUF2384)
MDRAPAFVAEMSARWARADIGFIEMMRGYRCRGGLAREVEVLLQLQQRPLGAEARSAPARRSIRPEGWAHAIRFEWGGWAWLPLFQFSLADLSLREAPALVVDALGPEFDGWEAAQWFITRNNWLHDRRPIDVMDTQLGLVLEAARTDRFVAGG